MSVAELKNDNKASPEYSYKILQEIQSILSTRSIDDSETVEKILSVMSKVPTQLP